MDSTNSLKDEFDFYNHNKSEFLQKYDGKYISLKNHKIICEAASRSEAIRESIRLGESVGTFLVQFVSSKNDESIQRFYSRAYC